MNAKKAKKLRKMARDASPVGEPVARYTEVPRIITRPMGRKIIRKQTVVGAESTRGRYIKLKKGEC